MFVRVGEFLGQLPSPLQPVSIPRSRKKSERVRVLVRNESIHLQTEEDARLRFHTDGFGQLCATYSCLYSPLLDRLSDSLIGLCPRGYTPCPIKRGQTIVFQVGDKERFSHMATLDRTWIICDAVFTVMFMWVNHTRKQCGYHLTLWDAKLSDLADDRF
jgi:hypothetical protein